MDQLIASLPKTFIAIVVLTVGLLVMRQVQPPHTVCDSQMELFKESQKKFLYASVGANKITKPALIKEMTDTCKAENSPGACFELFLSLRKLSADLDNLPNHCGERAAEEEVLQAWLFKSMKLMSLIAWGERMPASHTVKNGWFDTSEITLFCSLRRHAIRIYGNDQFHEWQRNLISTEMPNAGSIPFEQLWPSSLFSTPCDMYR